MKGKFYSFLAHTIHLSWVIKNSILVVIISLARTQILFPIAASRTKKIRELNFFRTRKTQSARDDDREECSYNWIN